MAFQISTRGICHFSPLRYPGGKSSLFFVINDLISHNDLIGKTYVEPYAGGAGVALSLLMMEKVSDIVINDFDYAIYCFWRAVINEPDRLIRRIEKVDLSVDEWKRQRRIYSNTKSEFSLGFATFYLNRTSYSGVIKGSGPIGGFNQKGNFGVDARFNRRKLIEKIERISFYSSRISVRNEDGLNLIKEFARRRNVFVYLDPPYYVKGSKLYLNAYDHDDHLALAKALSSKKRLRWVLTYDNVPAIRKMYHGHKMASFEIGYSANKKFPGKEIMFFSEAVDYPDYCMGNLLNDEAKAGFD